MNRIRCIISNLRNPLRCFKCGFNYSRPGRTMRAYLRHAADCQAAVLAE